MSGLWRYGEHEFGLDIFDVDVLSRLTAALGRLKDGVGRDGTAAGRLVPLFFDEVFGDGASRLLFIPGKTDGTAEKLNACACFIKYAADRCAGAGAELEKWEIKYLPRSGEAGKV